MTDARNPCPCQSTRDYRLCCGPLHQGSPAASAEALMRSRYSAFVLGHRDYLLSSWHPSTRPASLEMDTGVTWLGLSIRSVREVDATHAEVEFIARFRVGGAAAIRQHERSRFVRESDHWYYLDGVNPNRSDAESELIERHRL